MWDFLSMVPTFWALANALPWAEIGFGLFIISEALANIPAIKANSVFETVYNFLLRFKR